MIGGIGKYYYQRNTISRSSNIGLYISPRLKITITDLEDNDHFYFTNIEHGSYKHKYNNNEVCSNTY